MEIIPVRDFNAENSTCTKQQQLTRMGMTDGGIKAAETRDVKNAFCSPVFATEISRLMRKNTEHSSWR